MLKNFLKSTTIIFIKKIGATRIGRVIMETLLNQAMERSIKVFHKDIELIFSTPNPLTVWRASTFSDKEPETLERTPWHHDQPYYCVNGGDTCSLWIPLDPVPKETCVQFIAKSHKWGRWFTPKKFVGTEYTNTGDGFEPMPDIDSELVNYELLSWEMSPGDCIAFNFLTVHGAPGNVSKASRRRAFAARFTGDDATFIRRSGEMSPPFPEIMLDNGAKLDSKTFPVLFGA